MATIEISPRIKTWIETCMKMEEYTDINEFLRYVLRESNFGVWEENI